MEELKDYNGEFKPDLKLEDFSKEALVQLCDAASRLIVGIDGIWRDLVKEYFGEEKANELSQKAWQMKIPMFVGCLYGITDTVALKLEDFSKEALIKLRDAEGKLILGVDAIWRELVKQNFAEGKDSELGQEAWRRNIPLHIGRGLKALNIEGDDVTALFKYFQIDPTTGGVSEEEYDLKSGSHGVMTMTRCFPLELMEMYGDDASIAFACQELDGWTFQYAANVINPNIEAKCIKRPPRSSKDEIACKWEFSQV